jgi:ribonuclease P protein component
VSNPNTKRDKQTQRICSGQQFRKIYQEGQRFSSPFFTAFVLPNELETLRFGITVTRKVGNAVVRNRCKRRMRAIFQQLPIRPDTARELIGLDLVFNVKTELIKADFSNLVEAFERTLSRAETFWRKKLDDQLAQAQLAAPVAGETL